MPGTLAAAVVSPTSTVFPASLSTSFAMDMVYPLLTTSYHDGSVERSLIEDDINSPRPARTWALSKRLTTAQLATLRAFWVTVMGGLKPMYFYDPYEPGIGQPIGSNYDATGVSTQGRVKVIFRGANWTETTQLGRHEVNGLMLVEVA